MKSFGNYHPTVLLTYFLSVLAVAMFVSNPILQLLALAGGILFCSVLLKRSDALKSSVFYLLMFLTVAVTNPLFSHNGATPIFFLNGNPVTVEALVYGVFMAVMLISVMIWFRCYTEIMTTDKFLYLFGKIIPKLSLVISMALRFIPMFRRQLKRVSCAQKTMGLYSSDSFVDKLKSAMRLFTAIIAWSLENAIETSASMKARGYGIKKRTNFSIYRFSSKDAFLITVCVLLLGIVLLGSAAGVTEFSYYPHLTELNFCGFAIAVYISYGILSVLPFIIEIKEALLWKYSVSKI